MEYRAITAENFYLIEMKNTCKFILENKVEEDLKKFGLYEGSALANNARA